MGTLNERILESDVVVFEEESLYSRKEVTVASGAGNLAAGAVLGKITASGKYVLSHYNTGVGDVSDGSQTAVAVLLTPVDASAADQKAVVLARTAIVNHFRLSYDASVTNLAGRQAKADELEAVGILVREGA